MERSGRSAARARSESRRCMKVLALSFAVLTLSASTGAEAKFHALALGAYPPGSRVPITMMELNAYLRKEAPVFIGPGVRNARVVTDTGNIARGYADID